MNQGHNFCLNTGGEGVVKYIVHQHCHPLVGSWRGNTFFKKNSNQMIISKGELTIICISHRDIFIWPVLRNWEDVTPHSVSTKECRLVFLLRMRLQPCATGQKSANGQIGFSLLCLASPNSSLPGYIPESGS